MSERLANMDLDLSEDALKRIKRVESSETKIPRSVSISLALVVVGWIVVSLQLADSWLGVQFSWWGSTVALPVLIVAILVVFIPVLAELFPGSVDDRWDREPSSRSIAVRWTLILVVWGAEIGFLTVIRSGGMDDLPGWLLFGIAAGTLAAVGGLVLGLVAAIVIEVLLRIGSRTDPVDAILYKVLDILTLVKLLPLDWVDLNFRAHVNSQLEEVARLIEREVPRRLANGELRTRVAIQEVYERRAAAVRELQLWIALPHADTRQRLIDRLSDMAARVADGDWESLASCDPFDVAQSGHLSSLLRNLIVALVPAILLIALQLSSFRLRESALDYAILGSGGWAVLSLMLWIDPSLPDKVSLFSEVRGLMKRPKNS